MRPERPYTDVPSLDMALAPNASCPLASLVGDGQGPVEIEIGSGYGHFLIDRGGRCPETRLLGLEIRRKCVFFACAKAAKKGLSNVRFYRADVRSVLPRIRDQGGVERFFVHFPDPWWKRRHQKRSVFTSEVCFEIARLLGPGGELYVQTDVEARARDCLLRFGALPYFDNAAGAVGMLDANPFGSRSLREIKCEAQGLPVFRLLYRRNSRPASGSVSISR